MTSLQTRLLPALLLSPILMACPAPKPGLVIPEPTTLPPQAKVVILRCPPGQYLRGGRHVWRDNRWQWVDPKCTPRPARWRDGCVWLRGRWSRRGDRIVYSRGRIRCPGDPDPDAAAPAPKDVHPPAAARPRRLPPPPPSGAIGCAPKQYLQVGHYVWRDSGWRWLSGRCVAQPAHWKPGCRWQRGRWQQTPAGLAFNKGRLHCP